ncbi:aldo/keto reductase [Dysgonomonas sp. Marseille-P4361]|uniref:aldo/keto reductase n=1 Tax=Dysgonomonas sp. Marseille-P4361 TaxID=2161820 RepID=UPI002100C24E|nr:aldo/keto reductase [Dysgonomonas sp. Marseille-P4361]
MKRIDRRKFIKAGMLGVAGLSLSNNSIAGLSNLVFDKNYTVDKVSLGNTGISMSRIGLGTGTIGYNHGSNQTRLGMDSFVNLARHAYDRGMSYFDMAESYGSHPYVGKAIKGLPRENITLCTKVWTHPDGSDKIEAVEKTLDRFRKDLDTDYIDILLMHCLMEGNWPETRKYYMDEFSKAKQSGILKSVGVSCHNWDAMAEAVDNPWVDVILARINPFTTHMDGTPEDVKNLLKKARDNGKGIIGMKIFGEGKNTSDEERSKSLHFAINESNIHSMTIGLESIVQVDDLIDRTMKIVNDNTPI